MAAGTWTAIAGDRAVTIEQKQVFVLRIAAQPGAAGVHALRRLLKYAGRYLGLSAIDVRQEPDAQKTITNHTTP